MGFSNRDKTFWMKILLAMAVVGVVVIFVFFPIYETPLCTVDGCTDVNIQKSLWDIYMENKVEGGFNING